MCLYSLNFHASCIHHKKKNAQIASAPSGLGPKMNMYVADLSPSVWNHPQLTLNLKPTRISLTMQI